MKYEVSKAYYLVRPINVCPYKGIVIFEDIERVEYIDHTIEYYFYFKHLKRNYEFVADKNDIQYIKPITDKLLAKEL